MPPSLGCSGPSPSSPTLFVRSCFEWKWRVSVESCIASFERIWSILNIRAAVAVHYRATVKPSFKYFLWKCLTTSLFHFLGHPATVNISAHTAFADCCKGSTGTCFMSTLRFVLFWKLNLVLVKKVQNSLLLCWRHFNTLRAGVRYIRTLISA